MLLPLQIKSLTNNTKLINTVSRLGLEISYTKLSEITTEVTYSIINKYLTGMVFLPLSETLPVPETSIHNDCIEQYRLQ